MKKEKYSRIVVKVGTSTLSHESGKLNLRRIESLARVLSDLKNSGIEIVLVSSGAVGAGIATLGLDRRPKDTAEKQALAAVGQSELMKIYERFFSIYGQTVAQLLLTKDVVDNPERRESAANTFRILFGFSCLPIVNENDPVSSAQLETKSGDKISFGDNDTLSAYVAELCDADLLINLSDSEGFFTADPRTDPNAKLIEKVERITPELLACAGGAGTAGGTGGMRSKLEAAQIAGSAGIPMFLAHGAEPEVLYSILEGKARGTYFAATKQERI